MKVGRRRQSGCSKRSDYKLASLQLPITPARLIKVRGDSSFRGRFGNGATRGLGGFRVAPVIVAFAGLCSTV